MSRRIAVVAILTLPLTAQVCNAATPAQAALPAPTLTPTPMTATPAPGTLQVTTDVQLNLTKLNPLATSAGLSCLALVDDGADTNNRLQSARPPVLPAGVPASWGVWQTAFADIGHTGWAQVNLSNGEYQGVVTLHFQFSPKELSGHTSPIGFAGHCWLLLGGSDLSTASPPPFAVLDASGITQVPNDTNIQWFMSGTGETDLGPQLIQFNPL